MSNGPGRGDRLGQRAEGRDAEHVALVRVDRDAIEALLRPGSGRRRTTAGPGSTTRRPPRSGGSPAALARCPRRRGPGPARGPPARSRKAARPIALRRRSAGPAQVADFAFVRLAVGRRRDAPADDAGQDDDRDDVGQRPKNCGGMSSRMSPSWPVGGVRLIASCIDSDAANSSAAPNAPSGVQRPKIIAARAMNPRRRSCRPGTSRSARGSGTRRPSPAKTPPRMTFR